MDKILELLTLDNLYGTLLLVVAFTIILGAYGSIIYDNKNTRPYFLYSFCMGITIAFVVWLLIIGITFLT